MFKIALVQNISEMRNYAYADIRKVLRDMGFDVISIIRDNIETLDAVLHSVDCVLFSSNSLNDNVIYDYVCTEEFIGSFNQYLENNGAVLVMHQHKLIGKENVFPFLNIEELKLEKSYAGEEVKKGTGLFLEKESTFSEQYFMFPNQIDMEAFNDACIHNHALDGYYWQTLKGYNDEWSPILVDENENVIILRTIAKKIAFSSVLLDFQGHKELLHNILVNLMIDNISLAIYETDPTDDLGFEHFLNSASGKKIYYKRYGNEAGSLEALIENIRIGLHSVIILKTKDINQMPKELEDAIKAYGVKVICIQVREKGADSFEVHSMDRRMAIEFFKMELKIQEELAEGFVSGSFMKTVDILMKLKEFELVGKAKGTYTKERVSHVLKKAFERIEEDGSFDETFGASCKALWLFHAFCGENDSYTQRCKKYLQRYDTHGELRDSLEKYYVLSAFEGDAAAYLKQNCYEMIQKAIENNFEGTNEFDLLQIVKVALKMQEEALLISLFGYIKSKIDKVRDRLDVYVASVMSSQLVDMYYVVQDVSKKEEIRKVLFDLILFLKGKEIDELFPEEKIQYVCALYKFESELSFPTGDLIELISGGESYTRDSQLYGKKISLYEKTREKMDGIMDEKLAMEEENKRLRLYKKGFFITLSAIIVLLYVIIYLLFILEDANVPLAETLMRKIKETWFSLFGVLVIPAISFMYKKFVKKEASK